MKSTLLAGSAYRTVPHGPITALDTSVTYLHAHPDVVRNMQLAIMESNGYLATHPQETRNLLGKYTTVPKSVIAIAVLPTFVPSVPLSLVQKEADFNVLFGLIKKAPPLASYNTKVPITLSDYKK
jgi:ABC-type nitrate/sulfonate/bicarbonate transport system substrate-binding protein